MSKITMIKKDAIISIKISSGFLQMLQRTMMFIVTDKTEEDLENFKKAVEEHESTNEDFPETWMDSLFTMTVLIKEIETSFINEGETFDEEITPVDN